MRSPPLRFLIVVAVLGGCSDGKPDLDAIPQGTPGQDLRFVGTVKTAPPDTPESLAKKRAQIEANLKQAQELAARGELAQSVKLLEDSVMLDPKHREVLWLLVRNSQALSKTLEEEDWDQAYRLIVQAGGYMQTVRESHPDLTQQERQIAAEVLFDVARSYGRTGRHEEMSDALSAAVADGFDDAERIRSEPAFKKIREYAPAEKILSETAAGLETRTTEEARKLLAAFASDEFDPSLLQGARPPIDLKALRGKTLVLLVGDPREPSLRLLRDRLLSLKQQPSFAMLEVELVELDQETLAKAPGTPKPPTTLFISGDGELRLVLSGDQRPGVSAAICRELISSTSEKK